MEAKKSKIGIKKKKTSKNTFDELLERLEKDEEALKQLQEKFNKQKKEIRKWLSLMG